MMNSYDEAIDTINKAMELFKESLEYRRHLEQEYEEAKEKAKQWLDKLENFQFDEAEDAEKQEEILDSISTKYDYWQDKVWNIEDKMDYLMKVEEAVKIIERY